LHIITLKRHGWETTRTRLSKSFHNSITTIKKKSIIYSRSGHGKEFESKNFQVLSFAKLSILTIVFLTSRMP